MTEKEENNEESNEETEITPKTIEHLMGSVQALLESLSDLGYTREETVCILALANTVLQGELFMKGIMDKATLIKVPVKTPPFVDLNKN